jgi:hypothetical protein
VRLKKRQEEDFTTNREMGKSRERKEFEQKLAKTAKKKCKCGVNFSARVHAEKINVTVSFKKY